MTLADFGHPVYVKDF